MSKEKKGLGASAGAGDWLVIRAWNLRVSQIEKVTPKLYKLKNDRSFYHRQIARDDPKIICAMPDRETAERIRDSVAGIDGEFARRQREANATRDERVKVALAARDAQIARLLRKALPLNNLSGEE